MTKRRIACAIIFITAIFCAAADAESRLLNAADWDSGETVELGADWDFYWDQLLYPSQFLDSETQPIPDARFVPDFWSKKGYSAYGKGTYRQVFRSETPFPEILGIRFMSVYSAYRVWINGELAYEHGVMGTSRSDERGNAARTSFYFAPRGAESLDIIVQVTNYEYKTHGGIGRPPVIGSWETISHISFVERMWDLLLAGSLGFMGLYLLVLFVFRTKDKTPLYLGLFALFMVFRQLMVGGSKLVFTLFPSLTVYVWDLLQAFGIYPLLPLFLLYIYSLFPQDKFKWFLRVFVLQSVVLGLLYYIPFLDPYISVLGSVRDIFIIFGLIFSFWMALYALVKKQNEAGLVFIAMLFIMVIGIHDALVSLQIAGPTYYLGTAVWMCFLFQSFILARRFSRAFAEVETLSGTLAEKTEALLEMDRMKDEFLANTSHELKTPLNGIIGITESLAAGDKGPLSPEQLHQLDLVSSSGRRLFSLVNDILDHARLRNGKLAVFPRSVDFWTVAEPVCEFFSVNALSRGIELRMDKSDGLSPVYADPARLEQILYNLLGNALKFTESGWVSLSARESGGLLCIEIADSGIGIPADKQELIFESFQQADGGLSRRYGGTGLGLTIAAELAALQNGSITVQSEVGKGSLFTVALPLSDGTEEEENAFFRVPPRSMVSVPGGFTDEDDAHSALRVAKPSDMPLVLVVDDESTNRQILMNALSSSGYKGVSLSGGNELLSLLDQGVCPDMVLLDIMMPGMNGYEALVEIRKTRSSAELPVLLLTAKNRIDDLLQGFSLGANDFITKPFSRQELLARIRSHLLLKRIYDSEQRFAPADFLKLVKEEVGSDLEVGSMARKEMTVLYSDLRAFTSFTEGLSPEEGLKFFNSYLSRFAPIIRDHGGFVDRYVGDGLLALFPGSATDALRAAEALRLELDVYNGHRSNCAYAPVDFGMGIHRGLVTLALIGEGSHVEAGLFSETVSLSIRLESLTRQLHTCALVSTASLGDFTGVPSRFVGRIRMKGRKTPLEVSELLFERRKTETLQLFNQAVQSFYADSIEDAAAAFATVTAIDPDDKVAALYLKAAYEAKKNASRTPGSFFLDSAFN